MPLKLFGALLLSAAGLAAGCRRAAALNRRRRFWTQFLAFISRLETGLRYRNTSLYILVNSSGELFKIPEEKKEKPFEENWRELISPLTVRFSLSGEDRAMLERFGERLGKTDLEGQLSHLALYSSLAEKQLGSAEEDVKGKAKLYRTLGLFAGVSAAIMMM